VYLEALSELQDRLPSFPNEIAWAVMEEELGCPVSDVYAQLSEQPVAAASLGQVYKGVLRETGETVAVKVQRPGIGESIAVDMLLLRRLMGAVDKNLPQISQPLVPLVDEFAARLFAELDYVQEGKNAEKFQVRLNGHGSHIHTCVLAAGSGKGVTPPKRLKSGQLACTIGFCQS
jgi:predicted unusual protein kinase regulating ubiquinone biosynthesis (AarF/ABC1/UbiB family)